MYEKEREVMIDFQLRRRGISNEKILSVMAMTPRHEFVPEISRSLSYGDFAIPIKGSQTISQPYIVAKMLELLDPHSDEKILEVGSGSGYVTALLSRMSMKVIGVEKVPELVETSRKTLKKLGIKNAGIVEGDGSLGQVHYQTYDKIIVSAACPEIPQELLDQLKNGGILVAPVGSRMQQKLVKITKKGPKTEKEEHDSCAFLPLLGKKGFQV